MTGMLALRNCRMLLVDLYGTLHTGKQEIPGAIRALARLKKELPDVKLKYATNMARHSRRLLQQRLEYIGFDIKRDEIHSSLSAARNVLVQRNLKKPLLMVRQPSTEEFDDFVESATPETADCVVLGLAPEFLNYEGMNNALRVLKRGKPLFALYKSKYFRDPAKGYSLGPGAFVTGLEYAADVTAEVVGKPAKSFFIDAIRGSDCLPEQVCVIGDNAKEDIAGACTVGCAGILVQTGKYQAGDEEKIRHHSTACVAKDFPQAVELIINAAAAAK